MLYVSVLFKQRPSVGKRSFSWANSRSDAGPSHQGEGWKLEWNERRRGGGVGGEGGRRGEAGRKREPKTNKSGGETENRDGLE